MTDKAVQELLQNMQKYLGMDVGRATIKRILQDHGIVPDPELKRRIRWMKQIARNQIDCIDGFLKDKRYLVCDRDPLFTKGFEEILKSSGVKIKRTPPWSPNMNPFSEAFCKTLRTECLGKMIFFNERQVRYAVEKLIYHYNTSRPHAGTGGKMIAPLLQDENGKITEFESLGGLLRSYRRVDIPLDEAA